VSGDGSAAGAALGVGKACAEATGSGFGAGDGGKATRLVTPFPSASTVTPRCLITTKTVRAMITTNANRQGAVNLELIRWPAEPAVLLDTPDSTTGGPGWAKARGDGCAESGLGSVATIGSLLLEKDSTP
jgi:hypothetical protein